MATSEVQLAANRKYHKKLSAFTIKLKPDELKRYKKVAADGGKSFRGFVLSAMEAAASKIIKENHKS